MSTYTPGPKFSLEMNQQIVVFLDCLVVGVEQIYGPFEAFLHCFHHIHLAQLKGPAMAIEVAQKLVVVA